MGDLEDLIFYLGILARVPSPLAVANALFALNAGEWFWRGRFVICSFR